MFNKFKKGQSTAEYAIVIGLVLAAAVAMQVYVKRGIQAKMKDASDAKIEATGGEDFGVNSVEGGQYDPDYITSPGLTSSRDAEKTETMSAGGKVERITVGGDKSTRSGVQVIEAVE
jgi:uncharacterized protein (UPF0333 family)